MAKQTRDRTLKAKLGGLQHFSVQMAANSAELQHLEPSRVRFVEQVGLAEDAAHQQGVHTAAKQESSRKLQVAVTEGERLANILRLGVKQHYGLRSEKLAEFGLQPFRGRKVKKTAETPEPTTEAAAPATADPHHP
jgi:hypothetical protein